MGDTDIGDAFAGVEVEVEVGVTAAQTPDIDDASQHRGRFHVLVRHGSRNHIDDNLGALAIGRFQHLLGPVGLARIDDEVGAEFLEPCASRVIGRGPDDQPRAPELGDLQAHQADAGARALDDDGFAGLQPAVGHDGVMHGAERDRIGRGLLPAHVVRRNSRGPAVIGDRIFGVATLADAHHPVARLEAFDLSPAFDYLARVFDAGNTARGAGVSRTVRARQLGAVHPDRAHLDQYFGGLGLRLLHLANFDPVFADHGCLHVILP